MRPVSLNFQYGGNMPQYNMGGQTPQYEAEGGEVIEGGNPVVHSQGNISPNSSNAGMIEGNSHTNGGEDMSGGERIYSDSVYISNDFIKSLGI